MKIKEGAIIYIEEIKRYHYFAYIDSEKVLGGAWYEQSPEKAGETARDWDINVWESWIENHESEKFEMIKLSEKAKEIKAIRIALIEKLFTGWLNI